MPPEGPQARSLTHPVRKGGASPPRPFVPLPPRPLTPLLAAALLQACAIVGRPDGGPVDRTPPALDTLASTPNFQTDFTPEVLTLVFDEYVQLKDASRSIVLTPTPAEGRPIYRQRGREVTVDFTEVALADSTTYQLQFGESIQDFNEGNPARGLKYVFSTGSFLDSLTLRGEAVVNETGEPAIDALVALYRTASDTALQRSAPDYFARADSSGRFLLDYLAPGDYQLAAYADANANYRLEAGAEAVGFLDTLVPVRPGIPDTSYRLVLSDERAPLVVLRAEQFFPGLLRVTLNQPAPPEATVAGLPGPQLAAYRDADTLLVAYDVSSDSLAADTLAEVVVELEGQVDTARLRKTVRDRPVALTLATGKPTPVAGEAAVDLTFNLPLAEFDARRIDVVVDSAAYPRSGRFALGPDDRPRLLRWFFPSDTVARYDVRLLPGALTDVYGRTNADTLATGVQPRRATEFGEVDLALGGLDSTLNYVVELIAASGETERRLRLAPGQRTVKLARVAGGDYSVRVVEDLDADGRYSPGDRRLGRQPERLTSFTLQKVQPDWIVEERHDVFTPRDLLNPVVEDVVD